MDSEKKLVTSTKHLQVRQLGPLAFKMWVPILSYKCPQKLSMHIHNLPWLYRPVLPKCDTSPSDHQYPLTYFSLTHSFPFFLSLAQEHSAPLISKFRKSPDIHLRNIYNHWANCTNIVLNVAKNYPFSKVQYFTHPLRILASHFISNILSSRHDARHGTRLHVLFHLIVPTIPMNLVLLLSLLDFQGL